MQLPKVDPDTSCLLPDGGVAKGCTVIDAQRSAPFPDRPPPAGSSGGSGSADFTFRLPAASQASSTDKFAPEYLLNEKPWPLAAGALKPLLFANLSSDAANEIALRAKPAIHGIPLGAVVDLVIENQLNESIPLYKHGNPAWLLGSRPHDKFAYASVAEAIGAAAAIAAGASPEKPASSAHLNLEDPALVVVHDLPPLGWSVLRFKVSAQAATMIHATKLRYFLVSCELVVWRALASSRKALPSPSIHGGANMKISQHSSACLRQYWRASRLTTQFLSQSPW